MTALTRAMVMAAGLGTRMGPLTETRPKPLIEVLGKPLIDHVIDHLAASGITFIVVNVHYKADQIRDHLARRKDVEIHISDETDAILDTGGGIKRALPLFEGEPFFTQNADSLWVEGMGNAIARMRRCWDPKIMDALMLVAPIAAAIGYDGRGDFEMGASGALTRRGEMKLAPFAWTGLQLVHPRLFDDSLTGRFSINPLWDRAIDAGRLFGLRLDGNWLHVGTPEAREAAEAFLADLALQP